MSHCTNTHTKVFPFMCAFYICRLKFSSKLPASFSILTLHNWLSEGLALNFHNACFPSLILLTWTAGQGAIWSGQLRHAAVLIEFHFLAVSMRLC